jgi:hypothetical protein
VAGLVDAAVHATPEMLDESPEKAWIGFPDGEIAVDDDLG